MKRNLLVFLLLGAVCFSLLLGSAQLSRDTQLNGSLVRLHVIAASNSPEDQRVKLLVRDAILQQVDAMDLQSMDQAVQVLGEAVPVLAETAREVLHREGFRYAVQAALCTKEYPRRDYGTFSLPAGEYVSLQIRLGEAEGQNWWCVVYPGLCHACDEGVFRQAAEAAGLSDGQIRLMQVDTSNVQFRFKILEWLQRIKNFF